MEVIVRGSFLRDLKKYKNKILARHLKKIIRKIEDAENASRIDNLVKLKRYDTFYRIKMQYEKSKTYRIGLMIRGKKVWLMRFSHRHNIYKKFP